MPCKSTRRVVNGCRRFRIAFRDVVAICSCSVALFLPSRTISFGSIPQCQHSRRFESVRPLRPKYLNLKRVRMLLRCTLLVLIASFLWATHFFRLITQISSLRLLGQTIICTEKSVPCTLSCERKSSVVCVGSSKKDASRCDAHQDVRNGTRTQ